MLGDPAAQPDYQLVKQAQTGDEPALSQLYEKYFRAIYRFHYWQTNHHKQSAEDLTQDTFLEAARSLHTFSARSSFKNWLYTIAKRQLTKWLRYKYHHSSIPLLPTLANTPNWVDPQEQSLKIRHLETCLALLSSRENTIIRHRYLENLSIKETAAALNLSLTNVKVISHRALKKLQTQSDCNEPSTINMYEYAQKHI